MMIFMRIPCARFYSRPHFSVSYLGPLAGVVLGIMVLYSSSGRIAWSEPYVNPPTSSGSACLPFRRICTITISQNGRLFFMADDTELQTAVIERVARKHGIRLNAEQKRQLQQMPYAGLDIRQLPIYLASTSWQQRYAILKAGIPQTIQNKQLAEYIDAINSLSTAPHQIPVLCEIRADRQVSYIQFRQVANLLQQRNINRIFLGTQIGH
jgi:biopolymer transport protein ExbD